MKKYICLLFLISQYSYGEIAVEDPVLGVESPSTPEKSSPSLVASRKLVDESILKAFNEIPLGDKKLDDHRPCYRIFIGLGGKNPTLLKWNIPNTDDPGSTIEAKQLVRKDDSWQIVEKRSGKVTNAQVKLLQKILEEVKFESLPNKDWTPDERFDGTSWVYEIPVAEGYVFFNRWCPATVWMKDFYNSTKITPDRLARENYLSTLGLMLWMISGLGPDEP